MHIRRTDKLKLEAEFIPSSVFWKATLDAQRRMTQSSGHGGNEKLKVYIASEDVNVLPEFRNKFKGWEYVGCESVNGTSQDIPNSRISDLFPIIRDIWVLFNCDYVVGTFSSNVNIYIAASMRYS